MKQYSFEEEIIAHANEALPQECCGWVLRHSQKGIIIERSPNTAENPETDFRVDVARHLQLLRTGTLLGYYHSHPEGFPPKLSPRDIAVSEEIGLPCYMYSLRDKEIKVHRPSGYKPPLIGRPYIPRILDCYTLARDYYAQNLKIETPVFDFGLDDAFFGAPNLSLFKTQAGFKSVVDLQLHDVILCTYKSIRPNHLAVYLGGGHILHHLYNQPSCAATYAGFWKRNTAEILRHTTLFK